MLCFQLVVQTFLTRLDADHYLLNALFHWRRDARPSIGGHKCDPPGDQSDGNGSELGSHSSSSYVSSDPACSDTRIWTTAPSWWSKPGPSLRDDRSVPEPDRQSV